MPATYTRTPRRARPMPVSAIARNHRVTRLLAALHDVWLARRAEARWHEEFRNLDERVLRDIGANQDMIEDHQRATRRRLAAVQLGRWRVLKESTFPPHCEPDVAKLGPNIKA